MKRKPDLPVLDDETYALIRKYLFGGLSDTENEILQEKIKDLSVLDALQIGFQLKKAAVELFIDTTNH